MRALRRSAPLLPVVIAVTLAAPAARSAEGRTSSLSWNRMPGADSCISTQALARAVEERLGRPGKVILPATQGDVSVEGRIEKKKTGGWHAIIQVRDEKNAGASLGTRELDRDDASCDAMSEPLAFVIAVMIDPEAAMARKNDPPPPPTSTATPTTTTTAPPPPPPPPTATATTTGAERPPPPPKKKDEREGWRFEGGADGIVAAGLTPTVAPGGGVYGMLFPPGVPVGFRGFASLFPSVFGSATATKDGASASFDMLYLGGTICPTIRGRVNVEFCFGGQLGVLRPRAETPNRGISEAILPLWNALVELRTSFTIISPIGATAGIGGALPLLRPDLEYNVTTGGSASLFKVSPVAAMADAGIGFVFP